MRTYILIVNELLILNQWILSRLDSSALSNLFLSYILIICLKVKSENRSKTWDKELDDSIGKMVTN